MLQYLNALCADLATRVRRFIYYNDAVQGSYAPSFVKNKKLCKGLDFGTQDAPATSQRRGIGQSPCRHTCPDCMQSPHARLW